MRDIRIKEVKTASALTKSKLPELKYALNPYMGCLHGCIYCYAMDFTNDREASENWGSVIAVKTNIVELLKSEVKRLPRGVVGVSTVTDPYQPVEGRFKLTRESIDILSRHGFRVSIQTRSPMFTRDLDIMSSRSANFDIGMTIASPLPDLTRLIEPGAPPPSSRMSALRKASESGIETWIFLGPIIKGFNDESSQISEILEFASETGSRIIYDKFTPYRGASSLMSGILDLNMELYTRTADRSWWSSVKREINERCSRLGVRCNSQSEDWLYEKAKTVRPLSDFW